MTRLLIIEDNPELVANLYSFFEPLGYVLDDARDGATGLRLATQNDYDAILLDLMLPRLDGMTLCQKLRQEFQNPVPIIMLTARDPVDDRVQGLALGADDYLIKPFSLRNWMRASRRWCVAPRVGRCKAPWHGKTCRWTRALPRHGGRARPSA